MQSVWMRAIARATIVSTALCAMTACGGGGYSPSGGNGSTPNVPTAAKKYAVTIALKNVGTSTSIGTRAARGRTYVSPASMGAIVTAVSTTAANRAANDGTFGYDLNAGNASCIENTASASLDCSIVFALSADTYTLSVTAYDQTESTLPASPGTALSNDTETMTVLPSATANVFSFTPKAYVSGFDLQSTNKRLEARTRALGAAHRDALQAVAGPHYGVVGGSASTTKLLAEALDRDGYFVDAYPGVTTFSNGAFQPIPTEFGDLSGCTSSTACSDVQNSNGTTYPASYAGTQATALLDRPTTSIETLSFGYLGGGGIGSGIRTWIAGTTPTGQSPYYVDFSIPDPSAGTVTPYVVPHVYEMPLFGYATDGAGNAISTVPAASTTVYVWAAQAMLPDNTDTAGNSYSAAFDATGTSTCQDANGATVLAIASGTYHAGYGEVFAISSTPTTLATSCTLDLADGTYAYSNGIVDKTSVALSTSAVAAANARTRALFAPLSTKKL